MSGKVLPLRREGPRLTREQRQLISEVPGLAERVAFDVGRTLGGDPRSPDRINQAHLGIYKAAQTFDPALGKFVNWATWKAYGAIVDADRKNGKQQLLLAAGRIAGFRALAETRGRIDDVPADATDSELRGGLVSLAKEQIVGGLLGVIAALDEPADGEEAIAERQEWARATAALMIVLDSLQPENRALLLLFAHGHDVKAIANARGVDYGTLRAQFHEQLHLARARLEARNVRGVPSAARVQATPVLPEPELPRPRPRNPSGATP